MPEPVEAAKGAAGGVGNVLTKKVGPLPVYAYALIVGGGLLALRLVHGGAAASSSGIGGVGGVSSGSAGAGGNPAGSGANMVPPADTGPRQSPPVADTASAVPMIVNNYYSDTLSPNPGPAGFGGFYTAPTTRYIPSTPSLIPTAPVQPGLPGFPSDAVIGNIGGINYSLSDASVARGGVHFPGGFLPNANPPAPMSAAPVSSPTGPAVPSAPVQPPAPGARFETN